MTIVGILGTIHNQELREQYNSSLSLYKELIKEFIPDIICGEVHPLEKFHLTRMNLMNWLKRNMNGYIRSIQKLKTLDG